MNTAWCHAKMSALCPMHLVQYLIILIEFLIKLGNGPNVNNVEPKKSFNIIIHSVSWCAYWLYIRIFFLLAYFEVSLFGTRYDVDMKSNLQSNPLLPKITMVGISMGDGAQMSKANLKKTMEDLTKELEQTSEENMFGDEKDPLFVANVGDYSRITKISSA